ncbi:hypothetical protein [Curtobacterium sp. ZW137]|uniref:hypothetical protein n=1 Tax=Curtobacterium sp. ZW137 TaxID=2485104 RepID=UPI000F4BA2C8|nr:hypothetical protein [Curtobacterium sp. ZW137]ROP64807.1 hypothetical protein EDF55_1458 [Curtobacterium sp. ZW137]
MTSTASGTDSAGAKREWDRMNAEAEATQALIGGDWLSADTAARSCGANGAQWVIARFGPSTDTDARDVALDRMETRWRAKGWDPVRSDITGDAPGKQLRYPAGNTLADGFFIEFGITEHASTLQLQTPCTPGDANALNREKYGERHTNTPPDIPGTAAPSAESTS